MILVDVFELGSVILEALIFVIFVDELKVIWVRVLIWQ